MASIFATGRLGSDPRLTEIPATNDLVLNFSIADTVGVDKTAVTQWIDCAVWGEKRAKTYDRLLRKGALVEISGVDAVIRKFKRRNGEFDCNLSCKVASLKILHFNKSEDEGIDI